MNQGPFELSPIEAERARLFIAAREMQSPSEPTAIGGRWTYRFTPTSVGVAVVVRDAHDNVECDVTEYEAW